MESLKIKPAVFFRGKISLPGDKSVCHRALILSAISTGKTTIKNFSLSQDCIVTGKVFKQLGAKIIKSKARLGVCDLTVYAKGLYGLKSADSPLDMGESGTSIRLITGLLVGQSFSSKLIAAKSLNKRPMKRITQPLRLMGANIKSNTKHKSEEHPPFIISPANLRSINYRLVIPSAQVKSAILLAGLYAKGKTSVIEPVRSRDHTERMLKLFKADINFGKSKISIKNSTLRSPGTIQIPGDVSSAAFFIVGACVLEGSTVTIKSVGLNPTRTGLLRVLKRMGADITIDYRRQAKDGREPIGNIVVKAKKLRATTIKSSEVPSLIDELPIFMVVACLSKGKTNIRGVEELRVKETDRINSMVCNLRKMGADIKIISKKQGKKIKEDIVIEGVSSLKGARLDSFGDHRTAMSLIIAALCAKNESTLFGVSAINKSFPNFLQILHNLME